MMEASELIESRKVGREKIFSRVQTARNALWKPHPELLQPGDG